MESPGWFESVYPEEVYSFQSPLTVVLDVPYSALKEEEVILLSKILQAVKSSLAGVRIITESNLNLSEWTDKPSRVIAFLQPPKGIELYTGMNADGTDIIFSEPLSKLTGDVAAKQKLWAGLQAMFAK